MKKRELLLLGALVLGAVGFELRTIQLKLGYEGGLPVGIVWLWPALLTLLVAVGLAVCLWRMPEKQAYDELPASGRIGAILYAAAAGLLLASSVAGFVTDKSGSDLLFSRIVAALGVVTALSLLSSAAAQYRGKTPAAWTCFAPIVYLLASIVFHFRRWSVDPIVMDYCYKLLSSLAAMLGLFYAGGFLFDRGKRRFGAFFCLFGVYLACVTLADGGLEHVLLTGSLLLLLCANARRLVKN
ncbi:MAG: hypothetical protein IJT18_08175 [Oscillospiraceae bacterium]|nr:hypothetical protein [Oscillospiraceae bacterium]